MAMQAGQVGKAKRTNEARTLAGAGAGFNQTPPVTAGGVWPMKLRTRESLVERPPPPRAEAQPTSRRSEHSKAKWRRVMGSS